MVGFSEDISTEVHHLFAMMIYSNCIFGAVISDVYWGKFKTICYLSIFYAFGVVAVSISAIPYIPLSPKVLLFIGLALISFGSGGIKPCVGTYGGEQFKLPEQAAEFTTYFSLFYFMINVGGFLSSIVTPLLRSDVHCFGRNDCYSLAFGLPAVFLIPAISEFCFH